MNVMLDLEPSAVEIKIGNTKKELRYDLRTFKTIENQIGTLPKAFKLLNENNQEIIATFIWAGLLHQNPRTSLKSISSKIIIDEAIDKISEALDLALSDGYNFLEQWDWYLLYYTGTVTLNMSEESFWNSTPRKIISLLNIHGEIKKGSSRKNLKGEQAMQAFMSW